MEHTTADSGSAIDLREEAARRMADSVRASDPQMGHILQGELERQQSNLILIPSENYPSRAVLEVQGCIMSNKYAEGYPGRRIYHGCEWVDQAETLAIERARELFGAEHANVQPAAGAPANMAAYYALLEPGDTILAMRLDHGGHLTHGADINFSGRYYHVAFYGIDRQSERIDLDDVRRLALHHRPKLIVVGASAYPRVIEFAPWREIADEVGAYLMADIAHIAGLIAADVHPDPVPYCHVVTGTTHKTLRGPRGGFVLCSRDLSRSIDRAVFPGLQGGPMMHEIAAKAVAFGEAMTEPFRIYQQQIVRNARAMAEVFVREGCRLISGGTDNHLMLIDLRDGDLTGQQAADLLREANIITNKNVVPFDPRPATIASGIRPGTPALTSRGMREDEMRLIAGWASRILKHPDDAELRARIKGEVVDLCQQFPVYEDYCPR